MAVTLFVSCLSDMYITAKSGSDGALHELVEGACGVAKCSEKLQRTSTDACHSSTHMGMLALSNKLAHLRDMSEPL